MELNPLTPEQESRFSHMQRVAAVEFAVWLAISALIYFCLPNVLAEEPMGDLSRRIAFELMTVLIAAFLVFGPAVGVMSSRSQLTLKIARGYFSPDKLSNRLLTAFESATFSYSMGYLMASAMGLALLRLVDLWTGSVIGAGGLALFAWNTWNLRGQFDRYVSRIQKDVERKARFPTDSLTPPRPKPSVEFIDCRIAEQELMPFAKRRYGQFVILTVLLVPLGIAGGYWKLSARGAPAEYSFLQFGPVIAMLLVPLTTLFGNLVLVPLSIKKHHEQVRRSNFSLSRFSLYLVSLLIPFALAGTALSILLWGSTSGLAIPLAIAIAAAFFLYPSPQRVARWVQADEGLYRYQEELDGIDPSAAQIMDSGDSEGSGASG